MKNHSALEPDSNQTTAGEPGDGAAPDAPHAGTEGAAPELPEAADAARSALEKEGDELYDRVLRVSAEFDNYRKRVEKERRDLFEYAGADVLTDLLPIVDDLERALAAPAGADAEAYRKGVEIIYKQMRELLKRRNVTPVSAVGADFDPHVHQAVIQEVSDAHREGEVMAELRRGYRMGDRLLRPAMVKVAKSS